VVGSGPADCPGPACPARLPRLFNENADLCASGAGGIGMARVNATADCREAEPQEVVESLKRQGLPLAP
jgi:hypothetical protein